jgi:hypothetical protein
MELLLNMKEIIKIIKRNLKLISLINTASSDKVPNPLNTKLNPICHLLTLLGAHPTW